MGKIDTEAFGALGILPGLSPNPGVLPNLPVYGVQELWTFKRFNRGGFKAYIGVQAPPWMGPDRIEQLVQAGRGEEEAQLLTRIKRWADLTVAGLDPAEAYVYQAIRLVDGRAEVYDSVMTNEVAASINLPGLYNYPKWEVAPTGAVVRCHIDGSSNRLNPAFLSTVEQATALKAELGALGVEDRSLTGPFSYEYPEDEPRRVFYIRLAGNPLKNAGLLLKERYKQGIGAPGRWINPAMAPTWVPDRDQDLGERDLRPEIPFPIRDLYPEEELRVGGFAGQIQIFNRAVAPEPDEKVIRRIDKNVRSIKSKLEA